MVVKLAVCRLAGVRELRSRSEPGLSPRTCPPILRQPLHMACAILDDSDRVT